MAQLVHHFEPHIVLTLPRKPGVLVTTPLLYVYNFFFVFKVEKEKTYPGKNSLLPSHSLLEYLLLPVARKKMKMTSCAEQLSLERIFSMATTTILNMTRQHYIFYI